MLRAARQAPPSPETLLHPPPCTGRGVRAACRARSPRIASTACRPSTAWIGQHGQVLVVGQVQPCPRGAVRERHRAHHAPTAGSAASRRCGPRCRRRRPAPAGGPAAGCPPARSTPSSTIATWSASRKNTPVSAVRSSAAITVNSADATQPPRSTAGRPPAAVARPHARAARCAGGRRPTVARSSPRVAQVAQRDARSPARPRTPRRPCPPRTRAAGAVHGLLVGVAGQHAVARPGCARRAPPGSARRSRRRRRTRSAASRRGSPRRARRRRRGSRASSWHTTGSSIVPGDPDHGRLLDAGLAGHGQRPLEERVGDLGVPAWRPRRPSRRPVASGVSAGAAVPRHSRPRPSSARPRPSRRVAQVGRSWPIRSRLVRR